MKLASIVGVLLSVTIIEICPAAIAQEIFPTTIVPGGTVTILQGSNLYGNDVTLRNSYLPSGARKSWLDFESVLPAGIVVKYYIYIGDFTTEGETAKIRLQIWRPTLLEDNYLLVWERQVSVNLTHTGGALYEFDLGQEDQFQTQQGDRIGWTNEGNLGAISFQYVEGHRTFYRKVDNGDFPRVGITTYLFHDIHLPSIFSAAVQINTWIPTLSVSTPVMSTITTTTTTTTTEAESTSDPKIFPTTIVPGFPTLSVSTTAMSTITTTTTTTTDAASTSDPNVAAVYWMLWVTVGVCSVLMVAVIVTFTSCWIKVRRHKKALQAV